MGGLVWKGGPGNWATAANWTIISGSHQFPAVGDDATINAPTNYVVTVDGSQAAANILLDSAGAHLQVTGTLALGSTLLAQAGTLTANDALLLGGTYDIAGGSASVTGGTLDGVTWQGTLALAGTVQVANGLTLSGANGSGVGTLSIDTLVFADAAVTLDNTHVHMFGAKHIVLGAAGTLTLGHGATLEVGPAGIGSSPSIGDGDDTVINLGTLLTSKTIFSGNILIGGNLENDNSINVAGGLDAYFNVSGTLINNGVITINGSGGPAAANLVNNGTIVFQTPGGAGNGVITISGNYDGAGVMLFNSTEAAHDGARLDVAGTIGGNAHLVHGPGGMVIAAASIDPTATIENFSSGDFLILRGVQFTGNVNLSYAGTPSGGTLTVTDSGTEVATLHLQGIASGSTFDVLASGPGILIETSNPAPCFVAGTRIRIDGGHKPVEQLRPGDRVMSAFGGSVPVVWIGRRTVRLDRHRNPSDVAPIRICAGALAPAVPARDLLVSPEHAIYLDGLLIPARLLVNGRTVTQQASREVTYFHIELPQHDVVFAEDAPSESYLDTGNRTDFDNVGPIIAAHPEFSTDYANDVWQAQACAPQCRGGTRLAAVRAALERRAAHLRHMEVQGTTRTLGCASIPVPSGRTAPLVA